MLMILEMWIVYWKDSKILFYIMKVNGSLKERVLEICILKFIDFVFIWDVVFILFYLLDLFK